MYNYTTPIAGNPHSCHIHFEMMPEMGTAVAYVHTHPNSVSFSSKDKDYANNNGINAYVIGPDLVVKRYDYVTDATTVLGTIKPKALSNGQKEQLLSLQVVWDAHFIDGVCANGFSCDRESWPNS